MTRSGFSVIDAHHHVGSVPSLMAQVSDTGPQGLELDLTPFRDDSEMDVRLSVMNANGVDQAIVIPTHEYLRPGGVADTRQVNDAIAAYQRRDPAHFPAAVGIVEPLHGRHAYDELQRIHDELGLIGISFHARFQGVSTDSYLVRGLVERMAELDLVPFVHAYAGSPDEAPWMVAELAKAMPEVTMLVLDGFSGLERSAKESSLAAASPRPFLSGRTSRSRTSSVSPASRGGPRSLRCRSGSIQKHSRSRHGRATTQPRTRCG